MSVTQYRLRRLLRRGIETVVLLLIASWLVRTLLVQGLVFPVRVTGDSMAEALTGAHWQLTCQDCGIVFRCGAEHPPDDQATCPNCGHQGNALPPAALRRGRRVLIDKWSLHWRAPRRWEMVVAGQSGGPGQLAVKRIVGLPGEQVSIRAGDVYVNGHIARKGPARQRGMAILVHDDDFRPDPRSKLAPRWHGDLPDSHWRDEAGGYHYRYAGSAVPARHGPIAAEKTVAADPPFDWLTYRHWSCLPKPAARATESPVLDNYGYNQGLRRRLNDVSDLILTCRLKMLGAGSLGLLAHDGRDLWQVHVAAATGAVRLLRNSQSEAVQPGGGSLAGRWLELELAVIDRQVWLVIDGQQILTHAYSPSALPWQPTSRPLAIGARDMDVETRRLRVYRDVHYTHPFGSGRDWAMEVPLGDDEYFLLGDNSPVSSDSRLWPRGSVRRRSILGRVWSIGGRGT